MANNRLGELRRSTVVMTYGPGSVIDFRADGAPVSAVAAGLEEWDASFKPAGLLNPQKITEPRLQRKLSVKGFRLPPVVDEKWLDKNGNPDNRFLVAVRFPKWLQCPQCDRLDLSGKWGQVPGRAYRYCTKCTSKSPGQQKVFTIPVRFVMACPDGHLDEFPWHYWVGHKPDCPKKGKTHLFLRSERPGLAGLILSCPECKSSRSMDGIFSVATWSGVTCRGRRPWFTSPDQKCTKKPRALQRGASNLYFPVNQSALSIPPWSDGLQEALGVYWSDITDATPDDRSALIRILAKKGLKPVMEEMGMTPQELVAAIEERLKLFNGETILDIRQEEYQQLTSGVDTQKSEAREFEIRNEQLTELLRPFFSHVVRVVRLREVRATKGFTRINPPGDDDSPEIAPISAGPLDWLPAIEVRGEGVFLSFDQTEIQRWEKYEQVSLRAQKINTAWQAEWEQRYGDDKPAKRITSRFILIHSFAHALMRQLTLECGYSTAALRERLYVSEGTSGMAGLLIYTATSDSDGTLGGLQRQGVPSRIERAVISAIRAMEWCSSDPLCIEGMMAAPESLSLAACHACVLSPETACEEFNRFLDRAMLVGLPDNTLVGYFSPLLSNNG